MKYFLRLFFLLIINVILCASDKPSFANCFDNEVFFHETDTFRTFYTPIGAVTIPKKLTNEEEFTQKNKYKKLANTQKSLLNIIARPPVVINNKTKKEVAYTRGSYNKTKQNNKNEVEKSNILKNSYKRGKYKKKLNKKTVEVFNQAFT